MASLCPRVVGEHGCCSHTHLESWQVLRAVSNSFPWAKRSRKALFPSRGGRLLASWPSSRLRSISSHSWGVCLWCSPWLSLFCCFPAASRVSCLPWRERLSPAPVSRFLRGRSIWATPCPISCPNATALLLSSTPPHGWTLSPEQTLSDLLLLQAPMGRNDTSVPSDGSWGSAPSLTSSPWELVSSPSSELSFLYPFFS